MNDDDTEPEGTDDEHKPKAPAEGEGPEPNSEHNADEGAPDTTDDSVTNDETQAEGVTSDDPTVAGDGAKDDAETSEAPTVESKPGEPAIAALAAAGDQRANASNATAPMRVCRKCSTQSQTGGEFCPHCGASFVKKGRVSKLKRRTKLIIAVTLLVLVGGGGTTALVLKHDHDQKIAAKEKAAKDAADAKAAAAKLAQQQAEQRAADEAARRERERKRARRLKVSLRRTLIREVEKSITKDAKDKVNQGLLDGPILRTSCDPVGGGNIDDLADHTGNWSCLAITDDNADGTSSGYGFTATVNYDTYRYSWHLGNN